MKHFKYDSHIFSVPNAVFFIAKDLNGVLHGFRDEPKFDGKVWSVKGEWKWHIGIYEVGLLAGESLVGEIV